MMQSKILVTGGAGYIGSMLVPHLIDKGHDVVVVDSLLFKGDYPMEDYKHENYQFIKADLRDELRIESILRDEEFDVIIHLAAFVGEPLCQSEPEFAKEIKFGVTKSLVDLSEEYNISKFIFASTCSNYGISTEALADEGSKLKSLGLYSDTKIQAENYVLKKSNNNLHPTVLRFATVFGVSNRMRFDLLINEFVRDAFVKKEIILYNPRAWRPFVHISDVVRAIEMTVSAQVELIDGQIFNVGGEGSNIRKCGLVNIIKEFLPDTNAGMFEGKNIDPRNYRVSFEKIEDTLRFLTHTTIRKGIKEIVDALKYNSSQWDDPYDDAYKSILK